ncbi:MAG TPA: multicopper oxidase family protein [Ktedonobacteraceae bacterium]|nr:multicopper oxidase family protein [Ktedonobacteraceae bacterium]
MNRQTQIKQEPATEVKRAGIFTHQRLSAQGKIAAWCYGVATLLAAAGATALALIDAFSSDLTTFAVLVFITTLFVVSGVRWLQAGATLLGVVLFYLFFTQPYVISSLYEPKTDPQGGFGHFAGVVILFGIISIAFVANLSMVLQNFQLSSRRRWFAPASSVIIGMVIGTLVIGALGPGASAPASAAIAPLETPQMAAGAGVPTSVNMGMAHAPISVGQLHAPATAAHVDHFTLTAQSAHLALGSGITVPAWTFNGTAPGPTLHVRQGDELVVTLVNHLSFGVTIHWHGIRIVNDADGVAGVTQDAVKPGQSYIYRFIVPDAGTYWYHSHQFSYDETTNGLYGMLIVDPTTPTLHADVDESVALHAWNGANNQAIYTMNAADGVLKQAALPGQWVRLRIVNTAETPSGNPQLVTLVGAPFQVVSLDGHDLHAPQWLTATPLPIGSAQRYDIYFQMPAHGSVALITAGDGQGYVQAPALVVGQGSVPAKLPVITTWFDLTTYGTPTRDTVTPQSHFDATYNITLGNQMGTSLGRTGMTYTMNGKVFPNTGMIMVKEGQLIKLHFVNQTALYHPMHLHGHVFTVLAENGRPLTGSPVHQDTVLVPPHATYDVAFVANNPGIWMLHCHNFLHSNWGMDMMVMYNVSTPYSVGSASGNFPD